jgi:hypothetical protein
MPRTRSSRLATKVATEVTAGGAQTASNLIINRRSCDVDIDLKLPVLLARLEILLGCFMGPRKLNSSSLYRHLVAGYPCRAMEAVNRGGKWKNESSQ